VYFHFGGKAGLLKEAVDVAAVGDDEPIPLLERAWMTELRAPHTDPARILDLWVAEGRRILCRVAPLLRLVRDASSSDPDLAELWITNEQQRLASFAVIAQLLADRGALRPGMSATEARDIAFALNSPDMYWLLTTTCGWDLDRWQRWTLDALRGALLAAG